MARAEAAAAGAGKPGTAGTAGTVAATRAATPRATRRAEWIAWLGRMYRFVRDYLITVLFLRGKPERPPATVRVSGPTNDVLFKPAHELAGLVRPRCRGGAIYAQRRRPDRVHSLRRCHAAAPRGA